MYPKGISNSKDCINLKLNIKMAATLMFYMKCVKLFTIKE